MSAVKNGIPIGVFAILAHEAANWLTSSVCRGQALKLTGFGKHCDVGCDVVAVSSEMGTRLGIGRLG